MVGTMEVDIVRVFHYIGIIAEVSLFCVIEMLIWGSFVERFS